MSNGQISSGSSSQIKVKKNNFMTVTLKDTPKTDPLPINTMKAGLQIDNFEKLRM